MIKTDKDIYEMVKSFVPKTFKTFFNFEKKEIRKPDGTVEIIPNTVSIKIRPAESPKRLQNGYYTMHNRLVSFNIFTDIGGADQIELGINTGNEIMNQLDSLIGTNGIIDSRRILETQYIGLNEQGIPAFSLEYKITYN